LGGGGGVGQQATATGGGSGERASQSAGTIGYHSKLLGRACF